MAEKLTFGGVLDLETRAAAARLKAIEGQARDSFRNIKVDFNSAPLKAGSAALGRIRRDADQFEKSMEAANARVLAFGTAVGVIEGMRRSFLALIKTTADVETALTKISIVAGSDLEKTGTTIEKVGKQIFNVAKQTGQTFAVASEAYLELSRQGLGLSQSLERTKVSLDVVRASGAEHSKVISGLTAAYNAFSDTGLTYTQIAEKIANVDAKTTTSYEGLLDVLSRASSTARQTGTSFEELLAVTSTLKDLTARSESVIGNAFRSISTRLLDPKILDNLKTLYNIDTRSLDTNELLKPVEILTNVSNKLKEISDPSQRNEIVKSISGLYQADQLNALIKALSDASNLQGIYQKNLRASTEESDVLARSSKKFADTLNNQFAVLGVQLTEILNSFGKLGLAEPLSNLLNTISGLAENLKGAAENTDFLSQGFQTVVKVLGGALFSKAGLAAIGFVIGKIAKDFIAFGLEAGRSFLGLNKAARDQAAIQQSIAAYIQQSGQNLNVLLNSEQARLNLTKQIAAAWNQSVLSAQQMAAVTKQIAVPIFNSGLRAGPTGPSRRAADGFVPLVNAEMNDVKRGVGGANPNSKIVVMPNFPFGGGKRGMMVANSSETVVDYGGGKYGIMNPDMMTGRAAGGFLKGQKPQTVSGKFASVGNLESGLESLAQLLVGLGKTSSEITNAATNFAKSFNLNEKSLSLVVSATEKYAVSLKQTAVRLEQEAIAESRRIALGKADQTIRSAPEKRAAFLDAPILPTASGKFIERPSPKAIERALKESSEILTKEIANSAYQEIYNGILRKRQEILEYVKKNPPNPLALSLSRTSLPGRDLSGNPTFAYLNQPIRNPLSPQSADPLTRAQEIGRLRELERIKNQPRGLSSAPSIIAAQEDAAFRQRIRESTLRSNSLAAFGASQRIAAEKEFAQSKAPKGFDPEAFNKFAAKAFIGVAALEGFTSALRGSSEGLDKTLDIVNKAALAFTGIASLQQFGGFKVTDLVGKLGGLGKGGGGLLSKAFSPFIMPFVEAGKGLARFIPVIGQLGIGLAVINSVIGDITGKTGLQRINEALGELSDEAQKASEAFKEFSVGIFDPQGKFIGTTRGQASQTIKDRIAQELSSQRAKERGVDISGKTPQEIASENFKKDIQAQFFKTKTGRKTDLESVLTDVGGYEFNSGNFRDEVFAELDKSIQELLINEISVLAALTEEEIRSTLSSKGISKIDGKDIEKVVGQPLRDKFVQIILEQFANSAKGFATSGKEPRVSDIRNFLDRFVAVPKSISQANATNGSSAVKISPEDQKKLFEFQNELLSLTVQDSINSLESQIKLLDIAADNPQASARNKELIGQDRQKLEEQIVESVLRQNRLDFFYKNEALKVSGLSQSEKDQQSTILKTTLDNQEKEAQRSLERIKKEGDARSNAASDLERFSRAVNSANSALSSLSVLEAGFDAKVSALESRANNPALNVYQQEDLQRQINNARAESLRTVSQQRALATFAAASTEANKNPNEEERDAALKEASDAYLSQTIAINAQINALEEANKQIGFLASSSQEFGNLLIDFQRSLGRDRAQNQFNLLQSTDPQSRIGGLISEQVFNQSGNRTGSELVSFISDQNALLLEQSKIRTAANASEKLELETQYELTKQILEIKKQGLSPLEEQLKIEQAINANLKDRQTLERQRGLVQAKLSLDQSQRSLQRGARENEASALEALAGGANVGILESESLRRQALQKRQENIPSLIQDIQDEHENQLLDLNKKLISSPEDKSIDLQIQALNNATQERIDALKAESAALDENIRTLGEIPGFLKEFGDQLVNFERSLPSSAAQNKFNLLQSTDAQSRIGGLISQQVFRGAGITEPSLSPENQSRANLAAQISDQNALLLEQSKIRTAANASEKLELETQYELTKQILEIKKQGLSPLEEQLKIEQAINANLKDRQTFGFGVRQASAEAQTRMQNFSSDFGKTAFDGFRDGLSDAIKAAVSQTDNLKSALLDVALAFANKLRDKAIDNLADVISNSLFSGGQSKSSGGGIVSGIVSAIGGFFDGGVQKRATGGMVTGGTGKKDDVPTLLMGGEYVVPKNIVRQYGKGFFDRLRDGSVGKMAQGGYFAPGIRGQGTISGKENLLDFATQTATSGKGDLISSLSANAGLVSLEPESLRLTNFARFGDSPLVAATQDAKDQAFQLYLGQLEDEKAYAEYQAQLKKAEKEKKKQLWTSLAIAAVGAGLNYYGFGQQTASKSKETAFSGGKIRRTSERPNLGGSVQETSNGSYLSGLFKATAYGLSSIDPTTAMDQSKANAGIRGYKGFSQTVGASGRKLVPGFSVASNYFPQGTMLSINGQTFRVDDTGGMSKNIIDFFAGGDRGLYQKYSNWGGVRVTPIGRNSGGYSMGNGDTIPTMLSQDEFVLNKSATRKIGDKNLYALNNGAMPSGDNGSSAVVVAKLDELIEKTIGASNVTVNVTMNGGEEKSSNQNSDGQGDQNPRMLVQRIKEVVIGVIRDEQRPGGSLTKTR